MKLRWISSLFAIPSEEVSFGVVLMTLTDAEESLSLQENGLKNYIDYFVKTFLIISRSCNV